MKGEIFPDLLTAKDNSRIQAEISLAPQLRGASFQFVRYYPQISIGTIKKLIYFSLQSIRLFMTKRSIIIVLGVLIVILVVSVCLVKKSRDDKIQAANMEVLKNAANEPGVQAGAMLKQSQITFPKFVAASALAESGLPTYIKSFVVSNSTDRSYKKISYEPDNGVSIGGFFALYTIGESTVVDAKKSFELQTGNSLKNWQKLADYSSSSFAFMEFGNNVLGVQARVNFIQEGKDVKVQVKTVNAKI